MRCVVQRVVRASVSVDNQVVGAIGPGLVALVGIAAGDGPADIEYITSKLCELRIFPDADGRMNRSVADVGGALLVVSQFTLFGDVRKGRRPAFDGAEAPGVAASIYRTLIEQLRTTNIPVETGQFQASMQVDLVNDGPVTILLDSRRLF